MTDRVRQQTPNKPHRSFVVSDFSTRDIPVSLLAYGIISIASIAVGLAVESLLPFWRGVVFGIAISTATVLGLSVIQRKRSSKKQRTQ